jgi:L-lactate dehydrogenase complex protein LldG
MHNGAFRAPPAQNDDLVTTLPMQHVDPPPRTLAQLTASFDRLQVEWTRTSSSEWASVLHAVVEPPAIGASFPFDDLTLDTEAINVHPTPADVQEARTGVTAARLAIADYGTLVIQSGPDATEASSLFPALHVAVLRASDVVPTMKEAFQHLETVFRAHPTTAVLATGPSATADMGALVRGAHGPKRVHVILVEDR